MNRRFRDVELFVESDKIRRLQPPRGMSVRDDQASFRCARCGAIVPGLVYGQAFTPYRKVRNACTRCGWSAHVEFGTKDRPPCGALMRPRRAGEHLATWRCEGCGFTMRGPTEAALDLLAAGELESLKLTFYTEGSEFFQRVSPLPTPTALYAARGCELAHAAPAEDAATMRYDAAESAELMSRRHRRYQEPAPGSDVPSRVATSRLDTPVRKLRRRARRS